MSVFELENIDGLVIGGGPAGLMAAIYLARYRRRVVVFDNSESRAALILREELRDSKVTVTSLMPGATETKIFERADMMDTSIGTSKKDAAAGVAKTGFDAMMRGDGDVVTGFKNKVELAVANVTSAAALAKRHRRMAEPGSAKS